MQTVPTAGGFVVWHILAEMSVPVAEFGLALSQLDPVISWVPVMSFAGVLQHWTRSHKMSGDAGLRRVLFPLQRGYTRLPRHLNAVTFRKVLAMLLSSSAEPAKSVLVCTSSFWARTAASWPGPVVYYATDRTASYAGLSPRSVKAADRLMCGIADLVCPNSQRLADYLDAEAGCRSDKIVIVPNATRVANVRSEHCGVREEIPFDVPHLSRPVAGVIGNMGDNIDWELVFHSMELVPEYTWLFVGPVPKTMLSQRSRDARAQVRRSPRAMFAGPRAYQDLYRYARALDVAVLPYSNVEPTFSGSSTRFYEHLASGRPMLATRGVDELLRKEPLLTLVDNAEELARALRGLLTEPQDGREAMRCLASRTETWEARAEQLRSALLEHTSPRAEAAPATIRTAGTAKAESQTTAER